MSWIRRVATDAEVIFADHAGRFYAREYGIASVAGRLLGYLAVCDPPEQTIADLAEAARSVRCHWRSGGPGEMIPVWCAGIEAPGTLRPGTKTAGPRPGYQLPGQKLQSHLPNQMEISCPWQ